MNVDPIEFTRPWMSDLEVRYAEESIRSGLLSGDRPFTKRVAERLRHDLGVRHILMTPSCTQALELATIALGIGPGDEVICPSFTFVSTANAVVLRGARIVYCDIEPDTLNLDVGDAARRITERTRAIIPVHYAGVACDMDRLVEVAAAREIAVIEDAAQGIGATYHGRPVGTHGLAAAFSFHETKNLTCGEGGALATNDDALAAKMEIVREKGTNRSAFLRGQVDKYTWVSEGSSYLPSDVQMAILLGQLERAEEIAAPRRRVYEIYEERCRPLVGAGRVTTLRVPAGRTINHHIFWLLAPDEAARDAALDGLRGSGLMATFHYVPLHRSPFGSRFHEEARPLPVTEDAASRLLRLPLHSRMTEGDAHRVMDRFEEILP